MQKNSGGYFSSIEVDMVTGEYRAIILSGLSMIWIGMKIQN